MTVCIAAIAENDRAMVLCADRQRTQGEIRHEGRIAKKRELGYGWRFLYEDFGTRADDLSKLIQQAIDEHRPLTEDKVRELVHQKFVELRKTAYDRGQITRPTRLDLGLLLVGFNEHNRPVGYEVSDKGVFEAIREVGYGVIGSGQDPATATLAQYRVPQDDPLWKVMYKVYEAKRRSEYITVSVGSGTDMWIMTDQARRQTIRGDEYLDWPSGPIKVPDRIINDLKELYEWNAMLPWDRPHDSPYFRQSSIMEYASRVLDTKHDQREPT